MSADGSGQMPPPLELECLKALWKLGEGSVKDVRGALAEKRDRRRGAAQGRGSFFYSPVLSRDNLRRMAVQGLVNSFFEVSESALIDYLSEGKGATAQS